MPTIDILLATYNGAAYLPALIASIDGQSRQDFRVLARDDGSSDATPALLAAWQERCPDRVRVMATGTPSGGAAGNFARLMAQSDADYVLFADQDDIWHPEKVARTVEALAAEERLIGADRPVLVFCDLAVVDAEGGMIDPSFRHFQGMDATAGAAFHRLLTENVVTGCAMGINATARRLGADVPDAALMHDWWLALICAGFGSIRPLPEALIDYRQHGNNAVGAKPWSARDAVLSKLRSGALRANQDRFNRWMARLYAQASALAQRHGDKLPPAQRQVLNAFLALPRQNFLARRLTSVRYGFRLSGVIRTIGFYLRA